MSIGEVEIDHYHDDGLLSVVVAVLVVVVVVVACAVAVDN